jgi:hypothetical protein
MLVSRLNNDTEVGPEQVEIVAGQTVVWAVEDSPGVTITDSSLLPEP